MSLAADTGARETAVAAFVGKCRQAFGPDVATGGDATVRFTIDGQRPAAVCTPANIDELSRCVAAAADANLAVVPVGSGAQLGIGRSPRRYDVAMCTRRMSKIIAHEAADMTATVEAGVALEELNTELASAAQFLPLDPPRSRDMTVGGLIATDASGPLRSAYGKVRDLLIGVRAVLADGTIVRGGGRVVKNVAGYDVMKLLTGSHGTLAIIAEATFKIRPLPAGEASFVIAASSVDQAVAAGMRVLGGRMQPAYLEAVNEWAANALELDGAALVVGCHGSPKEIEAQHRELLSALAGARLEALDGNRAAALTSRLRELPALPGCGGSKIVTSCSGLAATVRRIAREAERRSLHAAITVDVGAGVALIRCPMERGKAEAFADFAGWLRGETYAEGGVVTFDALPTSLKNRIDPWNTERSLGPAQLSLMRAIKDALDPSGLLSPGRFIGGM